MPSGLPGASGTEITAVELVAQMPADHLCAAESDDRQRAEGFTRTTVAYAINSLRLSPLQLREQFDAKAAAPKKSAEHSQVSRATMYRAVGPPEVKHSPCKPLGYVRGPHCLP